MSFPTRPSVTLPTVQFTSSFPRAEDIDPLPVVTSTTVITDSNNTRTLSSSSSQVSSHLHSNILSWSCVVSQAIIPGCVYTCCLTGNRGADCDLFWFQCSRTSHNQHTIINVASDMNSSVPVPMPLLATCSINSSVPVHIPLLATSLILRPYLPLVPC